MRNTLRMKKSQSGHDSAMRKRAVRRHGWILCLVLPVCTWVIGGCAGYRLGSSLPADIQSVYVPAFENRTREPLLESDATRAVISEFQRDGTLLIRGEDAADVSLSVVLTDLSLKVLRYERDRGKTGEEFRLTIRADLVLVRTSTGETLTSRSVQGESFFDFTGDMGASKRIAIPLATADLAHDIVESVVELW